MFEGKQESSGRVQPIKFKPIGDESCEPESRTSNNVSPRLAEGNQGAAGGCDDPARSLRRRRLLKANLALEFDGSAQPAVTLRDVCFSVDKSQQQANFLKEVLFRLANCLNPILRDPSQPDPNRVEILKSVNLSVPHGSIFGLLGPSSCGKTTLLRCLVGLLKPSSGSIGLFGSNNVSSGAGAGADTAASPAPASWSCFKRRCSAANTGAAAAGPDCQVPGANVGYMPQDLGLYEDFTIEQLLTMFGRYMRMEAPLIKSRIAFMADFLELPPVGRQIQTLSGGQKRRVSFAIACLHMPPLIILDEPTVGVDPLLRQSIWKYLRRLASEENKTIIITTHYIEEAAQADQVALMRAGQILVQDTPRRIMELHKSRTLEEAFLKICNNVQADGKPIRPNSGEPGDRGRADQAHKLFPQPRFEWRATDATHCCGGQEGGRPAGGTSGREDGAREQQLQLSRASVIEELKLRAEQKLALYEQLECCQRGAAAACAEAQKGDSNLSMIPHAHPQAGRADAALAAPPQQQPQQDFQDRLGSGTKTSSSRLLKRSKFTLNRALSRDQCLELGSTCEGAALQVARECRNEPEGESLRQRLRKTFALFWALLYKNYRRNINSIPLLAFQFMLPMVQMISFSLCVGGRPTNIGLGVVNLDQPLAFGAATDELAAELELARNESLSLRYLSFLDDQMLAPRAYASLPEALADVRRAKLWAVLEIGQNFSAALAQRFDPDNFYQLELATLAQSVIRVYPDRSNKILDMICQRSLVDSYRRFLSSEFEHFRRLPLEVARPIFDIKPNAISNSIDGYTESIAPGLLASLTYIMAAGLTTFIMVVERSAGILERTYTSGIDPAAYLLAHALFRSLVMMLQIGAVLLLTFYVLQQPLVGSLWLAYAQLMVLNMTGIAYGLLISSIVADQNGAALTIVSSLVLKITMSGILWPFEAIPRWLRAICYIQPLTMPVQALKAITLKGATLGDRPVNLGFLVALLWLLIFLTVATKRFKFYQH